MKYSRLILFAGIFFLSAGSAARWSGFSFAPFLLSAGGLCKLSYIFLAVKSGWYRPGYEIFLLAAGLIFLACGVALKHNAGLAVYSFPLLVSAFSLKLIFAVSFIIRVRKI